MNLYELLAKWGVTEEGVDLILCQGYTDTLEVFIDDEELGNWKLEIALDNDMEVLAHQAYETEF